MDFTEAIHKAVELRGRNYRYPRREVGLVALYVHAHEGRPGCIIGHALYLMGVPLEDMATREGAGAQDLVELFTDEPRVVGWAANAAQGTQDAGRTWGEALDAYNLDLTQEG